MPKKGPSKIAQKQLTAFFQSRGNKKKIEDPPQNGCETSTDRVESLPETLGNAGTQILQQVESSDSGHEAACATKENGRVSAFFESKRPAKRPRLSSGSELPLDDPNAASIDETYETTADKLKKLERGTYQLPEHIEELHQKFQAKLINGRSKRQAGSDAIVPQKHTPLELQVVELKKQYPGILLIIEVGYKFRFFGKDAEIASSLCNIFCYPDRNFMTASVPVPRLHVYVRRLVAAGYKVGVVRQIETAALKAAGDNKYSPFTRKLSALYTRSTLEAGDIDDIGAATGLDESSCKGSGLSNYLVCLTEEVMQQETDMVEIGIVAVDTSTGDVLFDQFKDDMMRGTLEAHLMYSNPSELLVADPVSSASRRLLGSYSLALQGLKAESIPAKRNGHGEARQAILDFYTAGGMSETDAVLKTEELPPLVLQALGYALDYLKEFHLEAVLRQSCAFRPFSRANEISLSPNALRQLEVLRNSDDGTEKGSLLWLLDHSKTAMGKRLLKAWVAHPLRNVSLIQERLDAVEELSQSDDDEGGIMSRLRKCLSGLPDLERGITRILHKTASPAELLQTLRAFANLASLNLQVDETRKAMGIQASLLHSLLAAALDGEVRNAAEELLSCIYPEAAESNDKVGLIRSRERFPDLAECRDAEAACQEHLTGLLPKLAKCLAVPRLEYKSLLNQGDFLIEVDAARKDVPKDWQKISSVKKFNRFRPPEVIEAVKKLEMAKERLQASADTAYSELLGAISDLYRPFRSAASALAALDALQSFALVAHNAGYVRPKFLSQEQPAQIHICQGRHPVLDALMEEPFVPNDTHLGGSSHPTAQICTGPNMGGKSSYIRQVALICIMAQIGCFVPADSLTLRAIDAVHTRMGASDNLAQGRSTFLEELSETSSILAAATESSLIVIDELGRGTSTHDGMAIAHATLSYVVQKLKALTLFVTHYPEVGALQAELPQLVETRYMSYLQDCSETSSQSSTLPKITFLYKLVPGMADRSFGLNVARMALLPPSLVNRAAVKATEIEISTSAKQREKEFELHKTIAGIRNACHEQSSLQASKLTCWQSRAREKLNTLSFTMSHL